MSELTDRVAVVHERIAKATARAGRRVDEIRIVAVTKRHSTSTVQAAVDCGLLDVGENYAQEMLDKWKEVSGAEVRWHFIGHLQRNKAKLVVGRSWLIHCVGSLALAQAISRQAQLQGITQRVLVWLNIADEATKAGIGVDGAPALVEQIGHLEHIRCEGLAAMPPATADPESSRRWFQKVAELRGQLATVTNPLPILSLGTSNDFEVAIEEGSTLVRLGTVLFGPR